MAFDDESKAAVVDDDLAAFLPASGELDSKGSFEGESDGFPLEIALFIEEADAVPENEAAEEIEEALLFWKVQ